MFETLCGTMNNKNYLRTGSGMPNDVTTVAIFGDWHENAKYGTKALHRLKNSNQLPDAYLHVGDFGIFRPTHYDYCKYIDNVLVSQNRELWVVDGNHENHEYISALPVDERGLKVLGNKLFVLPRGYRWTWSGVRFASLGGAFSVNKHDLRRGIEWWVEETITQGDFIRSIEDETDVDILITHDSPALPPGKPELTPYDRIFNLSPEDISEAQQNREYIAELIRLRNVKLNVHGHHHRRYSTIFENRCKVIGLDKDGTRNELNRLVVNLENFTKINPLLNPELA